MVLSCCLHCNNEKQLCSVLLGAAPKKRNRSLDSCPLVSVLWNFCVWYFDIPSWYSCGARKRNDTWYFKKCSFGSLFVLIAGAFQQKGNERRSQNMHACEFRKLCSQWLKICIFYHFLGPMMVKEKNFFMFFEIKKGTTVVAPKILGFWVFAISPLLMSFVTILSLHCNLHYLQTYSSSFLHFLQAP